MGVKYILAFILFIFIMTLPLIDYVRANEQEKVFLKNKFKTKQFKTMMVFVVCGYIFALVGKNITIYVITYVGLVLLAIVAVISVKNIETNERLKDFRVALCLVFLIFLLLI